jgi:hypothetical protein
MSSNKRPTAPLESIDEATSKAESRSLDFNPRVRARFIREMIDDINIWLSQGLTEEQIREKVPEFAEKYPELFSKLIKQEDLSPIQSMLAMLDKMAEGNITQHQASIVVGKTLVDKFINPQLNGGGKK